MDTGTGTQGGRGLRAARRTTTRGTVGHGPPVGGGTPAALARAERSAVRWTTAVAEAVGTDDRDGPFVPRTVDSAPPPPGGTDGLGPREPLGAEPPEGHDEAPAPAPAARDVDLGQVRTDLDAVLTLLPPPAARGAGVPGPAGSAALEAARRARRVLLSAGDVR